MSLEEHHKNAFEDTCHILHFGLAGKKTYHS